MIQNFSVDNGIFTYNEDIRWKLVDGFTCNRDGLNYSSINETKVILVSWYNAGSCFTKELIRENFPEYVNPRLWGKTHFTMSKPTLNEFKDVKIIFVLSDPRDNVARITSSEGGNLAKHLENIGRIAEKDKYSLNYLNENFIKIVELLNFYLHFFGDRCIVIKYEDAYFNQKSTLDRIGSFLNLKPLYIDNINKYKHSIHKEIGIFDYVYNTNMQKKHYLTFKQLYDRWKYPEIGYKNRYHHINNAIPEIDYQSMLIKNGIDVNQISDRIKNINVF